MKRLGIAAVIVIPVILGIVIAVFYNTSPPPVSQSGATVHHQTGPCSGPRPQAPYVGVSPSGPWLQHLTDFRKATGVKPEIVVSYVPFGSSFDSDRACFVAQSGAMLMIQMNPRNATLSAIAQGKYDDYLYEYAHAVRKTGTPVILSFAHEMNGYWYPWGYQNTDPKVFIKAWRHMHDVFRWVQARNVIWCWTVNRPLEFGSPIVVPPRPWWPGKEYVDWVGIDAYYRHPANTFGSVFGRTIKLIHKFTHKPVVIAETGAAPGPQEVRQIRSLFTGARLHHLIGVVWFDINKKEDWVLEGRPAAITAFRAGARELGTK